MPLIITLLIAFVIAAIVARGGFRLLFGILAGVMAVIGLVILLIFLGVGSAVERDKDEHAEVQRVFSSEAMEAARSAAEKYLDGCTQTEEPVTCDGAAHATYPKPPESQYQWYITTWSDPAVGEGSVTKDGDQFKVLFPVSVHASVDLLAGNDAGLPPVDGREWDDDFELIVTMDGDKVTAVQSRD